MSFFVSCPARNRDNEETEGSIYLDDPVSSPFWLGVNYWPGRSAMYWWKQFSKSALKDDLEKIRETGLKIVRIFLLWEDFQPRAARISTPCLDHLVDVAEQAWERNLLLLPTFFTGHMCGVNWLPSWALWAKERDLPAPTFSLGKIRRNLPRNFYEDPEILEAQVLLVREVSGALKGHPAVWAWDLGNSPSRVVVSPDREKASLWLRVMTEELRSRDETIPITLGMDERNLWADPALRPQEASEHLDFLSVQGCPRDSSLSFGPADPRLPPFLGIVTQWLGQKEVLLAGFGVPSEAVAKNDRGHKGPLEGRPFSEEAGGTFLQTVLDRLEAAGVMGGLVSFFADYDIVLWKVPPLDEHVLERHMGLFRRDGSPKDFLPLLRERGSRERKPKPAEAPGWIDISPEEYEKDPKLHIERLYRNYREHQA